MRYHALILAVAMLCGCATTEQNVALIRSSQPAIAVAVVFSAANNADVEAAFVLVREVLQQCLGSGTLEPSEVMAALEALHALDGLDDNERFAVRSAVDVTLAVYRVALADAVTAHVQRAVYLRATLESLESGIGMGLDQIESRRKAGQPIE